LSNLPSLAEGRSKRDYGTATGEKRCVPPSSDQVCWRSRDRLDRLASLVHLQTTPRQRPPLSQIIHGSVSAARPVKVPSAFSNAQKNSVAFGWSGRFTPTFPAKLRASLPVTLGSGPNEYSGDRFEYRSLTLLPVRPKRRGGHPRIGVRKCAGHFLGETSRDENGL
jgi:hypothetical protein